MKKNPMFHISRKQIFYAGFVLYWEQLLPVFMPVLGTFFLYILLAVGGLFSWTGDPWRLFALSGLFLFSTFWLIKNKKHLKWPSIQKIKRRLEEDSELKHRPFDSLDDQPITHCEQTVAIWKKHQEHALDNLQNLQIKPPKKTWLSRDRFSLYVPVFLLFLTLFFFLKDQASNRLTEAFQPSWLLAHNTNIHVQAWITPPSYNEKSPKLLPDPGKTKNIPILKGSRLTALISGSAHKPSVSFYPSKKTGSIRIKKLEKQSYQLSLPPFLQQGKQSIILKTKGFQKKYAFQILPDLPPQIAFLNTKHSPQKTEKKTTSQNHPDKTDEILRFEYTASDDYGLKSVHLLILTDPKAENQKTNKTHPEDKISLSFYPAGTPTQIQESASLNLTEHRYAGQSVWLQLEAKDNLGQTAHSIPQKHILPKQIFINPLAKAIIEQRKMLLLSDQPYHPLKPAQTKTIDDFKNTPVFAIENIKEHLGRAPKEIKKLARMMRATLDVPKTYFQDASVYLSLQYVLSRIQRAQQKQDLTALDAILWSIAQKVEFGNLANALKALKTAEENLSNALVQNNSEREIALSFERYQNAVKRYLRVLAQNALKNNRIQKGENSSAAFSGNQFSEILKAIQDAYQLGLNRDARFTAQKLTEMLEKMKLSLQLGSGEGNGDDLFDEILADLLQGLGEAISQQRDLNNKTKQLAENETHANNNKKNQNTANTSEPTFENKTKTTPNEQTDQALSEKQTDAKIKNGGESSKKTPSSSPTGQKNPSFEPGFNHNRQIENFQRALIKEIESLQEKSVDPKALHQALTEMEKSANALAQKDYKTALHAQNKALETLRAIREKLVKQALNPSPKKQNESGEYDPLGRSLNAEGFDLDEALDEKALQRAREILEELKKRRQNPNRPQEEINYLERLLKRFGNK